MIINGTYGTTPSDPPIEEIKAQLNGLRWSMPAQSIDVIIANCTDPPEQEVVLKGEPGSTYAVTLRFTGVVETKDYGGGVVDWTTFGSIFVAPGPDYVQAPGMFVTGGTINPGYNYGANEYSMIVSEPNGTYWLNKNPRLAWASLPHRIEYTHTINMASGGTILLRAKSKDGQEVLNGYYSSNGYWTAQIVIPGYSGTTAAALYGQFIQMDVVNIAKL